MTREYRRLGRVTQGSVELMTETVPALQRLVSDFLAYQTRRNLSPYSSRNDHSSVKWPRRYCHHAGIEPKGDDLTTDFFRHYQSWLLALPLDVPRQLTVERRSAAVAARLSTDGVLRLARRRG